MSIVPITKTYKYSIKVNDSQWKVLKKSCQLITNVFNFGVSEILDMEKNGTWQKQIYIYLNKKLTQYKKDHPDLYYVPSHALQKALVDVDGSVNQYFKRKKMGLKSSLPMLKPEYCYHRFWLPNVRFSLVRENDYLYAVIPMPQEKNDLKLRIIEDKRDMEGNVRNLSIFKVPYTNKWKISIQTFFNKEVEKIIGDDIGVDVGAKEDGSNAIVVANENKEIDRFVLPSSIREIENKISYLQKRKSEILLKNNKNHKTRQIKKIKIRIRKLHKKIVNIRMNFIEQSTNKISTSGSNIYIEDLDVKQMTKNISGTIEKPGVGVEEKTILNRKILRNGFGLTHSKLKYKCPYNGSSIFSYKAYGSSLKCSQCGFEHINNRKGDKFICLQCGYAENADVNAAKNHVILGRSRGVECKLKEYKGFAYSKKK